MNSLKCKESNIFVTFEQMYLSQEEGMVHPVKPFIALKDFPFIKIKKE